MTFVCFDDFNDVTGGYGVDEEAFPNDRFRGQRKHLFADDGSIWKDDCCRINRRCDSTLRYPNRKQNNETQSPVLVQETLNVPVLGLRVILRMSGVLL